jgi:hypothetical protein
MKKRLRFLASSALLGLLVISSAAFVLTRSTGSARADTRARGIGFDAPVFVDQNLGGGEPSVIFDPKAHDYIFTAHESTTLTDHDGVAGSPDTSANWVGNYRNQVNVWWSPDGFTWTKVSWNGTGFINNPTTNTGFSDPDLTLDQGGRLYDTGIDLANDALFSSTDGGKTWPTGTINCHDGDRPWLAGGKPNEVFLATDTAEGALSHQIFHSTDGGASCSSSGIPDAGTIPKSSKLDAGQGYTGYGKLRYDTHGALNGALVEPIEVSGKNGIDGIGVSVLKNAAQAFKTGKGAFVTHVVSATQGFLDNMPSIDIDSAGDIFLTWSDNPTVKGTATGLNHVWLDMSRDGGLTWLPHPIMVAEAHNVHAPHSGTVLWPWLAAGSKGNVSVVWYQYDQVVPNPDQATCNCNVSVMDSNIFGVGTAKMRTYTVDAAGRPIHTGGICQSGTTCVATGQDRRLGDYFTNNLDARGCVIISTGDTSKLDPVTGNIRAWALPLFIHQNAGPSLTTGKSCGSAARAHHPSGQHRSHHRRGSHHHHRRHHHRPSRRPRRRRSRGFTG